jgi:hypothetical protein
MTPPTRVLVYAVPFLSFSETLAIAQKVPDCQRQKIVVNVLDRQGNVVGGLRPDEFRAELGGRSEKARKAARSGVALLFVAFCLQLAD